MPVLLAYFSLLLVLPRLAAPRISEEISGLPNQELEKILGYPQPFIYHLVTLYSSAILILAPINRYSNPLL